MDAPCHNCEERHQGCHSKCPKYQAYNAEREAIRRDRLIHSLAYGKKKIPKKKLLKMSSKDET